jgi:hypothetical protein
LFGGLGRNPIEAGSLEKQSFIKLFMKVTAGVTAVFLHTPKNQS